MHAKVKVFMAFITPILLIALLAAVFSPFLLQINSSYEGTGHDKNNTPLAAASVWDGTNTMPSGAGTEASPYLISSAANLAWLSANSASGSGKYYRQTVDIDLNNRAWTPINHTMATPIYYYDGGNFSISNLSVNSTVANTGLFGRIKDGYIRNTHIASGSVEQTTNSSHFTGGLIGFASNVEITNCSNAATVSSIAVHTGGIVGFPANNTKLTSCTNTGAVSGSYDTGGVSGRADNVELINCTNTGAVSGSSSTGGIVGYSSNVVKLTNCSNTGEVSSNGSSVGGIVGRLQSSGETTPWVLSGCANDGNVSATEMYAGGIAGYISGRAGTIEKCSNTGDISAPSLRAGGIVGWTISDDGLTVIRECRNEGSIYVLNGNDCGGIAGRADNAEFYYCYNKGAVSAWTTAGGIAGSTFQSVIIENSFNSANVNVSAASAGGIVGCSGGSVIRQCYNSGNISDTGVGIQVGGILGIFHNDQYVTASTCLVEECFSFGQVEGADYGVGGVVGNISSLNITSATVQNCFYNTDTVGSVNPPSAAVGLNAFGEGVGVTNTLGITFIQMKSPSNGTLPTGLTGFTASNWWLVNGSYPTLRWFASIELEII